MNTNVEDGRWVHDSSLSFEDAFSTRLASKPHWIFEHRLTWLLIIGRLWAVSAAKSRINLAMPLWRNVIEVMLAGLQVHILTNSFSWAVAVGDI